MTVENLSRVFSRLRSGYEVALRSAHDGAVVRRLIELGATPKDFRALSWLGRESK
jgi:hypothetical protein